MQGEIIVKNTQLPEKIADLAKFVLVGREKLVAVRANIRAIEKLELAEEVREQKREEAQMLAEALIDAEVRIGDLLKQIPKAKNQYAGCNGAPSISKYETAEKLGFNKDQVKRFETMASNKDIGRPLDGE